MKIFGKKRKHSATSGSASAAEAAAAQDAAADAVVLKILETKPDPATRNAKERRLIKRYEERQQEKNEKDQSLSDPVVDVDAGDDDASEPNEEVDSAAEDHDEGLDASEQAIDEEDNDVDEEPEQQQHDTPDDELLKDVSRTESAVDPPKEASETAGTASTSTTLSEEVLALLNQIPSKQRRKLVRSFERGEATQQLVEQQAREILQPAAAAAAETTTESSDTPKAKRRKKTVDESLLSPEERLRRQEQRRLQQEARERQEKGFDKDKDSKQRHPLNSERRRANRRKPKWQPKSVGAAGPSFKSQHASSGYQIRKIAAQKV